MLYLTTRDKADAFTAARALTEDRGPDGGLFVPYKFPEVQDLAELKKKTSGQATADILNLFFGTNLTGWDLDFSVGRTPVKLVPMNYRILLAEAWHNHDWDFSGSAGDLVSRVLGEDQAVSAWGWTAMRIACLFGVFSDLVRTGAADEARLVDLAVPCGDFSMVLAAWMARKMGRPIGTVICSCNENSGAWDLLNYGQLHTDAPSEQTELPECDYAVPPHLEAYIYQVLGPWQAKKFADCCTKRRIYAPADAETQLLRQGIFAAVVSQKRTGEIISSVDQTNGLILEPYSALAFAGLQDYRAKTGESRPALIWSERSPARQAALTARALGISEEKLIARLNSK